MPPRVRLLLGSALMLLIELSLIRWLGANIVHLAYFSNFVLLGSFLGIGLGFLRAAAPNRPPRPMPLYSLIALLGLIGFVSAYPVTVDRAGSSLIFFSSGSLTGPPSWLMLPAVFLAVAVVLMGPGEIVGSCFSELPRLEAYRLDLLGSLAGIAAFTVMSFLGAPPLVWFAVAGLLFAVLLGRPAVAASTAVVISLLALFAYPLHHDTGDFWSPYYKVTTQRFADPQSSGWHVSVNGIPHQTLTTAARREEQESFIQSYQHVPRTPQDVLIVGAGTGGDVAVALRRGVQHIDAVEIDPTLLRFGRQHNPDLAYQDPRVTAHVNDGRAFLQSTRTKYDLILFALPDSLTLVSGASSLRLESYLFTEQAIRTARAHLKPGGAFSMYNFYRQQWLVDRLAGTLADTFGHAPCVYEQPAKNAMAVLTAGLTAADQTCTSTWARAADTPPPASDDRPFLYLRTNSVPSLYRDALGLIILGSSLAIAAVLAANARSGGDGVARRRRGQLAEMWSYRDLFLLGAAFLLLETRSVTGFALYFGTTWFVNALVFAGVLLAVLAAVEFTQRVRTPRLEVMYGVLIGGLALSWLVPSSVLLSMSFLPRAIVAIVISFLPIFAANVIFAKRFSATADAPMAFGTNLLGAIVGGCLEYLSLIFGYRALLILAAMLYVGAYLVMPRSRTPATPADGTTALERQPAVAP
jgi:tRNA1(Val) A37 N6-methylase TrmN6